MSTLLQSTLIEDITFRLESSIFVDSYDLPPTLQGRGNFLSLMRQNARMSHRGTVERTSGCESNRNGRKLRGIIKRCHGIPYVPVLPSRKMGRCGGKKVKSIRMDASSIMKMRDIMFAYLGSLDRVIIL